MKSGPFLKQHSYYKPAEAGIEELRTKLAGNALSMTNSNEFDIGKTIDCKRFSN